jgi:6-pyruvoyltetrahydropterin/6-carboxytetrahydropterin synthase
MSRVYSRFTTPMDTVRMIEEYAFVGAHRIDGFPPDSRDVGMHGHTWTVEIHVEVDVGEKGYAFDHALLDDVADAVLVEVDHRIINDVTGLGYGTNEVLASWLWIKFMAALYRLDVSCCPMLPKVVLGQLSSGRGRRLVCHKTEYKPTAYDWVKARRLAGLGD